MKKTDEERILFLKSFGYQIFTLSSYPGVSIASSNNFVGKILDVFLHIRVFELSSNQTFCGKKSVFWVGDSLFF